MLLDENHLSYCTRYMHTHTYICSIAVIIFMQDYLPPLTEPILNVAHPSQKMFRTNRIDAPAPNLPTLHRLPGYNRHRDNP